MNENEDFPFRFVMTANDLHQSQQELPPHTASLMQPQTQFASQEIQLDPMLISGAYDAYAHMISNQSWNHDPNIDLTLLNNSISPEQFFTMQNMMQAAHQDMINHHHTTVSPYVDLSTLPSSSPGYIHITPSSIMHGSSLTPALGVYSPAAIPVVESQEIAQNIPVSSEPGRVEEWLNPQNKIDALSAVKDILKVVSTEEAESSRKYFLNIVCRGANKDLLRTFISYKPMLRLLKSWLLASLKSKSALSAEVLVLLDMLPWTSDDIKLIKELELGKLIRIAGKEDSLKCISQRLQEKIVDLSQKSVVLTTGGITSKESKLIEQKTDEKTSTIEGPRKRIKLVKGPNDRDPNLILPTNHSVSSKSSISNGTNTTSGSTKTVVKSKGPLRTKLSTLDKAHANSKSFIEQLNAKHKTSSASIAVPRKNGVTLVDSTSLIKPTTYSSFFDQLNATKAKNSTTKQSSSVAGATKVINPIATSNGLSNTSFSTVQSIPNSGSKTTSLLDTVMEGAPTLKRLDSPDEDIKKDQSQSQESVIKKKKKSVTFKPDTELVEIRYIERVDRDGNPRTDMHSTHEARDMDVSEGRQMRSLMAQGFGTLIEEVEWSDPRIIILPDEVANDLIERGKESLEKDIQLEREQHVVGAIYVFENQIPESPAEPTNLVDINPLGEEGLWNSIIPPPDKRPQLPQYFSNTPTGSSTNLDDILAQLKVPSMESTTESIQPLSSSSTILNNINGNFTGLPIPMQIPFITPQKQVPESSPPNVDIAAILSIINNVQSQNLTSQNVFQQSQQISSQVPNSNALRPTFKQYIGGPRVTCRYWLEGKCRKGDECTFKHSM